MVEPHVGGVILSKRSARKISMQGSMLVIHRYAQNDQQVVSHCTGRAVFCSFFATDVAVEEVRSSILPENRCGWFCTVQYEAMDLGLRRS